MDLSASIHLLGTLLGEADTVAVANVTLADYHRARRRALSTE